MENKCMRSVLFTTTSFQHNCTTGEPKSTFNKFLRNCSSWREIP